jgi:hypothetical protein
MAKTKDIDILALAAEDPHLEVLVTLDDGTQYVSALYVLVDLFMGVTE